METRRLIRVGGWRLPAAGESKDDRRSIVSRYKRHLRSVSLGARSQADPDEEVRIAPSRSVGAARSIQDDLGEDDE